MVLYIFYLVIIILSVIILNIFLKKKDVLTSETGDAHQKFASKQNTPLTGGILIFLSLLYLFNSTDLYFFFFAFFVLVLGFFSDLKLIASAQTRLFFQIFLIISFVVLNDLQIADTRIYLLDEILRERFINYFFVVFCILVVLNGSNFFDGLNTLSVGYYLLICLIIFYLNFNNQISVQEDLLKNLIVILSLVYFFNFFNQIFLGDSGSYLLGFIFSILLINIYHFNEHISPFFITLLLWYPSYELLFSIIRKNILDKSPMDPDSNHLHQLIFNYLKRKKSLKIHTANLLSANLINFYNLIILSISLNDITNTQLQVILIILNLIIYTVINFKLFIYRYKKI